MTKYAKSINDLKNGLKLKPKSQKKVNEALKKLKKKGIIKNEN